MSTDDWIDPNEVSNGEQGSLRDDGYISRDLPGGRVFYGLPEDVPFVPEAATLSREIGTLHQRLIGELTTLASVINERITASTHPDPQGWYVVGWGCTGSRCRGNPRCAREQ